jgi:hypothetical protein
MVLAEEDANLMTHETWLWINLFSKRFEQLQRQLPSVPFKKSSDIRKHRILLDGVSRRLFPHKQSLGFLCQPILEFNIRLSW